MTLDVSVGNNKRCQLIELQKMGSHVTIGFSRTMITLLVTTSTLTTNTLKTTTTTSTNKRQILETKAENSKERTLEPCPKDEHHKR